MSQLLALRDAVVARIADALPQFGVEPHLGRFSAEALQIFAAKAPAVRVAMLGLQDPRPTADDGVDYLARIGVYVVTKDGVARMSREACAIAAIETISGLTVATRWGLRFCKPCLGASAENLHSAELVKAGKAMWALDVRQPVRLHQPDEPYAAALRELWIGVAPKIGAAHRDDYLGPFPAPAEGAP